MDDLCKKCKNFEKCIEENGFDDCIECDYISYNPISDTCEGCLYEDWSTCDIMFLCRTCIRKPVTNKKDNYISKIYERGKYND